MPRLKNTHQTTHIIPILNQENFGKKLWVQSTIKTKNGNTTLMLNLHKPQKFFSLNFPRILIHIRVRIILSHNHNKALISLIQNQRVQNQIIMKQRTTKLQMQLMFLKQLNKNILTVIIVTIKLRFHHTIRLNMQILLSIMFHIILPRKLLKQRVIQIIVLLSKLLILSRLLIPQIQAPIIVHQKK